MTNRRAFLKTGATALAGASVLMFIKPAQASCQVAQVSSTISNNHGHAFGIALSDLLANGPIAYNIQGGSSHPHNITLSEDNLAALGRGESVTLRSDGASHTHEVVLTVV